MPVGISPRIANSPPPDPVLEVTGIAAADIIRRCTPRTGIIPPSAPAATCPAEPHDIAFRKRTWRLIDLADGSPEVFVNDVHLAVLNRSPYTQELARRVAELQSGRSRMELVARLALSPEGRRVRDPNVAGFALPILSAIGRFTERGLVHPGLGRVARGTIRPLRQGRHFARRSYRFLCAVPLLGGMLETLACLPRLGRLRREVQALRREVEVLRQGRNQ